MIDENLAFTNNYLRENEISISRFMTFAQNIENEINLSEKSLDLIICSEVLEHLESPELAMQNFLRILKKNGKVIITVPLNDPGHEHIQNFRSPEHFLKLVPPGFSVLSHSTEE